MTKATVACQESMPQSTAAQPSSSSGKMTRAEENPKNKTSRPSSTAHAVAGVCAGIASTSLLHPFDLVKTRLQVAIPLHQAGNTASRAAAAAAAASITPTATAAQAAQKQAAKPSSAPSYRSLAKLVMSILRQEGAAGLYKVRSKW